LNFKYFLSSRPSLDASAWISMGSRTIGISREGTCV
jgi:hypothetical protein